MAKAQAAPAQTGRAAGASEEADARHASSEPSANFSMHVLELSAATKTTGNKLFGGPTTLHLLDSVLAVACHNFSSSNAAHRGVTHAIRNGHSQAQMEGGKKNRTNDQTHGLTKACCGISLQGLRHELPMPSWSCLLLLPGNPCLSFARAAPAGSPADSGGRSAAGRAGRVPARRQ